MLKSLLVVGGISLAGCTGSTFRPSLVGTSTTSGPARTTTVSGKCTPGYLPDARCTPGSLNSAVNQSNIHQTICVSGYTATIRPPVATSNRLKSLAARAYGQNPAVVNPISEGDHLISLELGGNPEGRTNDISNFWDEPHQAIGPDGQPAGSTVKDRFENYLNKQVCSGKLTLAQAQDMIAHDWYGNFVKDGRPA